MPIGTLINVATVLIGSAVGLLLKQRFPKAIQAIIFQALGLSTLVLGMKMAFEMQDAVVFVFSLVIGGIIGAAIHLEERLEGLSDRLKAAVKSKDARFTEGLVTAFLIFCVGSMTFVGAISEGLTGDRTLLVTKATLDGFASIALASAYGIGVGFSVIPLFIFQAGLTLLAAQVQGVFTAPLIAQLTAVGGALIIGIGINLLEIKKIKTLNLLPALLVGVILSAIV